MVVMVVVMVVVAGVRRPARRKRRAISSPSIRKHVMVTSQYLFVGCHGLVALLAIILSSSSSIMVVNASGAQEESSSSSSSSSSPQEDNDGNFDFYMQTLGVPFAGQHTGVAVFDLNGDGHLDLLFSSGRHWVDQSYIMMNLGIDDNPDDDMPSQQRQRRQQYKFSKEYPIGKPGGYYQVDASTLSSLNDNNNSGDMRNHTAVLLAGSVCAVAIGNEFGSCELGSTNAAVLLDVTVQGCSVHQPHEPCRVTWNEVWREPNPQGNRNGAFAATLGDGMDPAIVLVGKGGISIFEPLDGRYDDYEPTFTILPDDHLPDNPVDDITRSTGLAVGYLGDYWPGIVVGPRTLQSVYPAPLIAVYKDKQKSDRHYDSSSEYDWYDFGDARYRGDLSKAPQPSGLVLADLNGDGFFDIVEANYLDPFDLEDGYGLDQNYYLLDHNGYGHASRVFTTPHGGRSVHAGDIYNDSELPDLAFGDSDGNVLLFANLGNHPTTGVFQGFEQRDIFQVSDGCEVRGIKIASLSRCSISILAAVTCLNGAVLDEGQNSNRAIHRIDPTEQSCLPGAPLDAPMTYPVDDPLKVDHSSSNNAAAAASLGQASSAAPQTIIIPVNTLWYQHYALVWAGTVLLLLH
jgi:hypothetical protein